MKKIILCILWIFVVGFSFVSFWYELTVTDNILVNVIEKKLNSKIKESPNLKNIFVKVLKQVVLDTSKTERIKLICMEVANRLSNINNSTIENTNTIENSNNDLSKPIPTSWNVIETITCVFKNNSSNEKQECRSESNQWNNTKFFWGCNWEEGCNVMIEWNPWYSLVWKSSCSNEPISLIDWIDEKIVFDCWEEQYATYDWVFKIMTENYWSYVWWWDNWDFSDKNWAKISYITAKTNSLRVDVESFDISNMSFNFSAENWKSLKKWLYYPAKRNAFRGSYNGIDISWDWRWCNEVLWWFYVHEYAIDNMWILSNAAIDFVFYCEKKMWTPIFWTIRYKSKVLLWCNQDWCKKIYTLFK